MPSIPELLERHRGTLLSLKASLESIPEERWLSAPEPGAWCPAEVFDHIGRIADGYAFKHLERCLAGKGTRTSLGLIGRLVFLLGRIPGSWRIRAPFPPELLPTAISKDEARALLAHLGERAEAFAPLLEGADPDQRARHFRLGWLNAKEWYQFAEMHHRHHLEGQLVRLVGR